MSQIRITKYGIVLAKTPKEDFKDGLKMSVPKLGKVFSATLFSGQRKYSLPPDIRGKDIAMVWIGK